MKIKKIKLENNQIFNNIVFDFCDIKGDAVDTIILAGENGCGKTTLLDIIYEFSIFSTEGFAEGEERIFEVELDEYKKEKIIPYCNNDIQSMDCLIIKMKNDIHWSANFTFVDSKNGNNIELSQMQNVSLSSKIKNNGKLSNIFSSLYYNADINYNPIHTNVGVSMELNKPFKRSVRTTGPNLSLEIEQLLIDIQYSDAIDLNDWVNKYPNIIPKQEVIDRRIKRFRNSFSEIFTDLNYKTIKTESGKKTVIFERNSVEIPISKLSSGEKQIVFRGAFLLKDKESTSGNVVLIDEPEISLHPVWQEKILSYYKKILEDNDGGQQSQLFVTTHSPYIINSETRNNDKVIVLKKISNEIVVEDNQCFGSVRASEVIESAFNTNWFTEEVPIIITEGCTDWKHMKAAYTKLNEDSEFKNKYKDIEFQFLEYEPLNSSLDSDIKLEMNNVELVDMCKNMSKVMQKSKLIFIADCDDKKITKDLIDFHKSYKAWGNNVFSLELPIPSHRQETPDICIEHYYTDDEIKTEYNDGENIRRIFLSNEFNKNGYNKEMNLKCDSKNIYGEKTIKILDGSHHGKIYELEDEGKKNYGLSKNSFASNILYGVKPFDNMDFTSFIKLFDIIKDIIVNN